MLQPRMAGRLVPLEPSISSLARCLNALSLCARHARQRPLSLDFIRNASHASQGRANGPKDSAGRRLGAKKTASEYVIPGNIIFRQRGTKWHPGENADIGRDHTIFATVPGYVCYYRDPRRHPKRRYIGVALEKTDQLPYPTNGPTKRRLGMYQAPIQERTDNRFLESHLSANSRSDTGATDFEKSQPTAAPTSVYRPGTYRESNYELGNAAEKKGIKVRDFDRKDRWVAWRKRTRKIKVSALARASKASRKTKGKKTNKGGPRVPKKPA